MSQFESQAAPPIAVTIGGREFLLTPLRFRDHAEAARRLRQDWPSPRDVLQRMGTGLSPEMQKQLLEVAYREQRRGETVQLSDVLAWYRTPEGSLFHKWLLLRTAHPELTLSDVDDLLTQAVANQDATDLWQTEETAGLPAGWNSSKLASLENIPWEAFFTRLADRSGWTPNEMNQMTIAQLIQYLTAENIAAATAPQLSKEEAICKAKLREQQRANFMTAHQETFQHDS